MGRPRKNPELAAVHGDTRKGSGPKRVHRKPDGPVPVKPTDLPEAVSVEWDRVTAMLAETGVLSKCDGALIRIFCETWVRRAECIRLAAALPVMFAENQNGAVGLHPLFKMIDKTSDQIARWSNELFLTPASRVRHGIGDTPVPTSAEVFGEEMRRHALSRPEVPKVEPLKLVNGGDDAETREE